MTIRGAYRLVLLLACLSLVGCGGSGGGIQSGSSGAGGGPADAKGQVTKPNKAAGTFTIQPLVEWHGFVPQGDSVDVTTGAATRFWDRGANEVTASAWFDYVSMNLSPSTAARAQGAYANGVIAAEEVRLE